MPFMLPVLDMLSATARRYYIHSVGAGVAGLRKIFHKVARFGKVWEGVG